MSINPYMIAADVIHIIAFIIVYYKICYTRSAAGLSGKTHLLFASVFTARYIDLMVSFISLYNTSFKIALLLISYGLVYLIYIQFKSTYERENDTFRFEFLYIIAAILALKLNYAHEPIFFTSYAYETEFNPKPCIEILWAFSIYLETLAIMPQLYMIYKNGKMEPFIPYYLLALFAYRGFYIVNWIYKYKVYNRYDIISSTSGVIQTTVYLIFFFLYMMKPEDDYKYEKKPIQSATNDGKTVWI